MRGGMEDRYLGALEAIHFLVFTLLVGGAGALRTSTDVGVPGREGRRQSLISQDPEQNHRCHRPHWQGFLGC